MKKRIFVVGGALILIIIIAAMVLLSNIGPIVRKAVNTYGPDITKTELRIEDVGVSVFSGRAKLRGFLLGNPRGFRSKEAMKVKSISVDVDKGSMITDTIIINRVEIVRPEITYEKIKGTDNFHAILRNVQQSVSGEKTSRNKSGDLKSSKKILIRDLVIRDGKVTLVQALPGDKSVTAPLPDIHLKNLGGRSGESPAEVANDVLKSLYGTITSSEVTRALDDGVTSITGGVKKGVRAGSSSLKGLFGK